MGTQDLWYGYKFYRSTLADREKDIYDQLYDGIKNCQSEIALVGINPDLGAKVVNAILADNPMFFHVESFTLSISLISSVIKPIYRMSELQYRVYIPQLESAINSYVHIAQNGVGSTVDLIQRLHDAITKNMRYYDDGMASHTVIGPLMSQQGVCEGIAKTVKLICDQLGVPSAVVSGTALSQTSGAWENHAWNVIKVDGHWQYFDFTYDLTLNASNPCSQLMRYDYFALSFDEISCDHNSEQYGLPIEQNSTNYFILHGLVVKNQMELSHLISRVIHGSSKDLAFQVSKAWHSFSPNADIQKALSLRTIIAAGFSFSYAYSYNDMRRVCYVHFN